MKTSRQTSLFLSAAARTFGWLGGGGNAPGRGLAPILGTALAGLIEAGIYVALFNAYIRNEIHPQIGGALTVFIFAVASGFSREAGLGRLVDRAFGTDAAQQSQAGERGAVGAGLILIAWIVKSQGFAQIIAAGDDISHPASTLLVLLPVTVRVAELALLELRVRTRQGMLNALIAALLWLALSVSLVPGAFLAPLALTAAPLLLIGGSFQKELTGRDLAGLAETGFITALAGITLVTVMY